jgi:peptidoglycan/xylan/chitin deacetylase (PgdA/CDA1 family)
LIKQGFSIGAHSLEHPCYNEISYDEQIKQTVESVKWVRDRFNLNYNLFSFPFSDYYLNKQIIKILYKEATLDMSFGTSGLKNDVFPFHFQRIPMENSKRDAQCVMLSQYVKYIGKQFLNMNTLKRD